MGAEFEDRSNIGMVQLGECQCFLAEPFSRNLIRQRAHGKDFNSYIAIELLIVSAVNDTHAARTNLLDDAIVAEGVAQGLVGKSELQGGS